jgi:hypothetical protein
MPTDEARIVQAARAWALALAALQEIPDQSEAELAMYGAADRVLAFKKAERALYRAVQRLLVVSENRASADVAAE